MSVEILQYTPQHYNSLPPVLKAGHNAEPSGAIEALSSEIGSVFVKHSVDKDLGIILLHNHFELDPSEILVQFGNAAVPWHTVNNSTDLKAVLPTAWRFVAEGLAPYEFTYANPRSAHHIPILTIERYKPFLAEIRAILLKLNLTDVLGLCVLEEKDIDGPAMVEIESGRSTITVDVDINPRPSDRFIHVIWQFGTKIGPGGEPIVFKKHKIAHKLKDGQHGDRHLTTKK